MRSKCANWQCIKSTAAEIDVQSDGLNATGSVHSQETTTTQFRRQRFSENRKLQEREFARRRCARGREIAATAQAAQKTFVDAVRQRPTSDAGVFVQCCALLCFLFPSSQKKEQQAIESSIALVNYVASIRSASRMSEAHLMQGSARRNAQWHRRVMKATRDVFARNCANAWVGLDEVYAQDNLVGRWLFCRLSGREARRMGTCRLRCARRAPGVGRNRASWVRARRMMRCHSAARMLREQEAKCPGGNGPVLTAEVLIALQSFGQVAVQDFGGRLGSWRHKCLQNAVLGLCRGRL